MGDGGSPFDAIVKSGKKFCLPPDITRGRLMRVLVVLLIVCNMAWGIAYMRLHAENVANDGAATECEQRSGLVPNISASDTPTGLDGQPGYDADVECAISDSRCKGRI